MSKKCPYCHFESDNCDFPDLFVSGEDTPELQKQFSLLEELQTYGYNIVTCGECGNVFIHSLGGE